MDARPDRQMLEIRLLGPLEVAVGGRTVEIGSAKQRALLAMLVLHGNVVVSSDALVEALWGDHPPPSASSTLRSLVARLRRALTEAGGDVPLRGKGSGYVLEVEPGQVDVHRFERLVDEARAALADSGAEEAAHGLREALALWRGPAAGELADCEFARLEAHRLEEARLTAVEDLAEAELALGRPAEALGRLEAHVGAHPLRERAWGQVMLALYRLGRQAEALRAYQHVRRILGEQLGIEPTPALRDLEERILHQRPELNVAVHQSLPAVRVRDLGDTVAFLFTDIEASTRRWEGNQEAMAADLSHHDELLIKACETWQGKIFAHTGDGLCTAFPTAGAALGAATAGQLGLVGANWVQAGPLLVRMAVHAGAAESRAGTFFGPTLNRTARLLATAAGGQIVCSQAAADLARDRLPAGITLVDLGEHRLADLARPERVFQVSHPDLPSDFLPLRSLDAQRHNLPLALTSFVGRTQELDQIDSLLSGSRLLTLTGVGGAGKTRLAMQLSAGIVDRFPDGAWLVDLGPLRDPSLVVPEVATALGLLPSGLAVTGDPLEDALCDQLRRRRLLLVLDNCEHLVDAAARLVHALLARCPDVAVLATSREVLGIPGEVVFRVPPLSLPSAEADTPEEMTASDAVLLFCERARGAKPGFGLNPANAGAVARICRHLDGIPLALELAAARIPMLSAHQVAERLNRRFQLLGGGTRTAVARHQTLRAAIDWSYRLLPVGEQTVLRRLSVFPGSFDLEAAEAVVGGISEDSRPGPGFEVLDLLTRLLDKSLLVVASEDPDVRYRLLETIREYAGEKLAEAGEATEAHQRHRDFFLAVADEWHRRTFEFWTQGPWLSKADTELDNFRAALEWSSAQEDDEAILRLAAPIGHYWMLSGYIDGCEWLERAVAAPGSSAVSARVEARIFLAFMLRDVGRDEQGRRSVELIEEALALAVAADDGNAAGRARYHLAELAFATGRADEAEPLVREALAAYEAIGSASGSGFGHHYLAWLALSRGDVEQAGEHLERALELAREAEDEFLALHVLGVLTLVSALMGEPDRAEQLGEEAVLVARRYPTRPLEVMALTRAAQAALLSDRSHRATALLTQLLGLLRDLGTRRWVADALEMIALVVAPVSPESAASVTGSCQVLRESLGEPASAVGVLAERVARCTEQLAETLGSIRWAENQDRGRKMTADDAIPFALRELARLSRTASTAAVTAAPPGARPS